MSGDEREAGQGMDETELTPEEKMAFRGLPREAEPSRILEERIVRSLRDEGLLRDAGGREGVGPGRGRASTWARPWMLAASMAASVVLFASGVILGQRMTAETTAQAFLAVREQDAGQLALTIQEAGSAYVSALVALGELGREEPGEEGGGPGAAQLSAALLQGSEVALGSLFAAAYELARLNPGDAEVQRVLQILEERRNREEGRPHESRNMVWF